MIRTTADIKKLGTILSVWAHPDDETFLAAGVLAAAVANGQTVVCVTATHGEAGSQDVRKWPLTTLAHVRAQELQKALAIIGVPQHYWLDYNDGCCGKTSETAAIAQLQKIIATHHPQTIITFGPDGWTGHTDHVTVSAWVSRTVRSLDYQPQVYHVVSTPECYERYLKKASASLNIFFNIKQPPLQEPAQCNLYLALTPELKKIKYRALAAMPSQTETMMQLFDEQFIGQALGTEAFVKAN